MCPPRFVFSPAKPKGCWQMIDYRRFPWLDLTGVWWNPTLGASSPWRREEIWARVIWASAVRGVGHPPRCAITEVLPGNALKLSASDPRERKKSLMTMSAVRWVANCWISASDGDGFARLRTLQQNMINGTCGHHTWCVFPRQICWWKVNNFASLTIDLAQFFTV